MSNMNPKRNEMPTQSPEERAHNFLDIKKSVWYNLLVNY